MAKFKYKVEVIRAKQNCLYSAKELEAVINVNANDGWRLITCTFHESNLCYELIFEKTE